MDILWIINIILMSVFALLILKDVKKIKRDISQRTLIKTCQKNHPEVENEIS